MDVRWTPNARADLHAIHDYIAQDSPQNALNFIDQLIQRADQIADFPRSGRMVPEYQRDDVPKSKIRTPPPKSDQNPDTQLSKSGHPTNH